TATGAIITFPSNGSWVVGASDNWSVLQNGSVNVYATIATGGIGNIALIGGSPPPGEGGPLHQGQAVTILTAAPAGTTELAGFEPDAGSPINSWFDVAFALQLTTVTTATVNVQTSYTDAGGTARTDIQQVVGPMGTASATMVATGRFQGFWHGSNQRPAVLGNNLLLAQLVIVGASAAVTGVVEAEIRRCA
ncbi:MAG: hypothetical protein L3K23_10810, partial [Thermoplasmata archaeon]|nr:hypothetical protein [Thermoplasmata archaeon]